MNAPRSLFAVVLVTFAGSTGLCAERFSLPADSQKEPVLRIQADLSVDGQLKTVAGPQKTASHDLRVRGKFDFLEHRLPGSGREARALRGARHYRQAEAEISVSDQDSTSRLRPDRRLIVAEGQRDGVQKYSPAGPLTFGEVELLAMPGDVLSVRGLLPDRAVEVGEEWKPAEWALQMLTATEAVQESDLTCRLNSVSNDRAVVEFTGSIDKGATAGAATQITVSGSFVYDLTGKFVRKVDLTQKEQREVGAVTPGAEVTATVRLECQPVTAPGPLKESVIAGIPASPKKEQLRLHLRLPWGVTVLHGRSWHLFHQARKVAVLRLIDNGSLVAQCNISPVDDAAPGEHVSEEQFQKDISQALSGKLERIDRAEQLSTQDKRFVYRVTAVGKSHELEMTWIYYLVADPSGRQTSLVFSVESKLQEQMDRRDLALVQNLRFSPSKNASREPK